MCRTSPEFTVPTMDVIDQVQKLKFSLKILMIIVSQSQPHAPYNLVVSLTIDCV